ncbi:septation ring formation regulator EzrA [Tenuibacillus multivorans]|uniref:Septation ring formation regulator EzrA n=1 Tax=Tenuibacillus multivorans TaxID=237069 RepID=A0A1H0EGH3_9BACI|nr:septation ring formation regulator EzrA [Tenuibacillus multivorans]GEL77164.1 septation ring formation regulator EzrA [Tenuibacillus multivorans]SDN81587.1 septation ring formation regulator [Tenuibacillus multivorans]
MEIILIIFITIVLFILVGVIMRKKVYQRVDALEEQKVLLMNRQVAEELGKVRGLNLTGETEELFESWRNEWDRINDEIFSNVEEDLLDAEESAERYRFGKAFRIINHIGRELDQVEKTIDDIFQEVDRLIHSEEDSRQEIEKIKPQISEVRKKVLQNGYQLGKAEVVFEVELDDIEKELDEYEQQTESGNYTEAHQLAHHISHHLNELDQKVQSFPELYRICKQVLPEDLDHLQNGLREMRDEGYRIQILGFDKEIHTHHETLLALIDQLNKGEDDGVEEKIEQIRSRILEIYDELEKEALDKNFVMQRLGSLEEKVADAKERFAQTKENVMAVKENYHLNDAKYEEQYQLEKTIDRLDKEAAHIKVMVEEEEKLYSTIRAEVEKWLTDYENWEQPQAEFDQYLHNLRKDEMDARDHISELKQGIINVRQNLQKSNLPGIPNYIVELVEEGRALVSDAVLSLEEQPLDMDRISHANEKAEKAVNRAVEQTELLIEQAQLAEKVIQYANRYRTGYPILAAKISEAEQAFLNYEYEVALEKVSQTLEEIEPGALKRIEEVLTETTVS